MEIIQRLLTKDEINGRFHVAVNAILQKNLMPSKASLAESLGVKPAKFSEILNDRMKAGTDMLAIMCDYYQISPDWLLMSRGKHIFRETALPDYWVDDDALIMELPTEKNKTKEKFAKNEMSVEPLMDLIREKDKTIRDQAEEIGKLKARLEEFERHRGANALDAGNSGVAHAG